MLDEKCKRIIEIERELENLKLAGEILKTELETLKDDIKYELQDLGLTSFSRPGITIRLTRRPAQVKIFDEPALIERLRSDRGKVNPPFKFEEVVKVTETILKTPLLNKFKRYGVIEYPELYTIEHPADMSFSYKITDDNPDER